MTDEPETKQDRLEILTAYLDGELAEQEHLQVEERLQSDPEFLAEMQALQKTWDLLDFLPQSEPTASFTKTTMEMVIRETSKPKRSFSWGTLFRALTLLVAFSGLTFAGYSWMHSVQTQSDRVLLDNLATVRYHEKFAALDLDLEFLVNLDQRGLFSDVLLVTVDATGDMDIPVDESIAEVFAEDPEQRRIWIQTLPPTEKNLLQKKLDNFQEFDPGRKMRLSKFGRALRDHPDRDQLVQTMNRYYAWLKSIGAAEQASIQDLPSNERVHRIAEIMADRAEEKFAVSSDILDADARRALFVWFRGLIDQNEKEIREHFPLAVEQFRARNGKSKIDRRYISLVSRRMQLTQLAQQLILIDRPFMESIVLNNDLRLLLLAMPADVYQTLEILDDDERTERVIGWLDDVMRSSARVPRERLEQFDQSLDADVRTKLDLLPRKARLNRLEQMYLDRNLPRDIPNWEKVFGTENPFEAEMFQN